MQPRKVFSLLIIAALLNLMFISCKKSDDNPAEPGGDTGENKIVQINSLSSGSVSTTAGHKVQVIPGTVPQNSTGQSGTVTFSIETKVTPPKALPTGASLKSDYIKVGPDGFNFRWPVKVTIPFNNADAADIKILYLDPLLDKWVIVPANEIDATAKTISIDVLTLGYFCAATVSSGFSKVTADDSDGGFEFAAGDINYYYSLTVGSVSAWKYSYQQAWYSNILGASGSTGSQPTGGPKPPTHIHLPQATYQIWITRTTPGTLSTLPKIEYYTVPATGTISQPVTYTSALSTGQGWTSLSLPGGGQWVEGRPSNWLQPTVTYGTGEFQATLTWANTSSADSDIDIHLFGPNDMHVYYGNMTSSDGSIKLDRDWQSALGNAAENIYSLSNMPSGSYSIYVNLYSGDAHDYSVRIVRSGSVETKYGRVTTTNTSTTDKTKMILITSFNK